jgi:hypothetical protein
MAYLTYTINFNSEIYIPDVKAAPVAFIDGFIQKSNSTSNQMCSEGGETYQRFCQNATAYVTKLKEKDNWAVHIDRARELQQQTTLSLLLTPHSTALRDLDSIHAVNKVVDPIIGNLLNADERDSQSRLTADKVLQAKTKIINAHDEQYWGDVFGFAYILTLYYFSVTSLSAGTKPLLFVQYSNKQDSLKPRELSILKRIKGYLNYTKHGYVHGISGVADALVIAGDTKFIVRHGSTTLIAAIVYAGATAAFAGYDAWKLIQLIG